MTRQSAPPGDRGAVPPPLEPMVAERPEKRLGVCAGEGIEPSRLLDLLTELVDKSLVSVDVSHGEARYRLLETIRAYAREKLEVSGEEPRLRSRHREWYLAVAEGAQEISDEGSPEAGQLSMADRLEGEYADIRAALAWRDDEASAGEARLRLAAALWRFWLFRGRWGEGREWLERILRGPR